MSKKLYDENGNEVEVKKKRGGCLQWLLYGFIAIIVLGACGALLGDSEDDKDEEQVTEETSTENEKDETEDADNEKEKEEPKEDDDDIEISENEDGVMIFDQYRDGSLSVNTLVSGFSIDMTDELKKHKDEITNGAVFRLAIPLTDTHGNESKKYVISVYYTQDTIDKINIDNWPVTVSDGLYETADGVMLHPSVEDNKHAENKIYDDEQPDEYTYIIGVDYEE